MFTTFNARLHEGIGLDTKQTPVQTYGKTTQRRGVRLKSTLYKHFQRVSVCGSCPVGR